MSMSGIWARTARMHDDGPRATPREVARVPARRRRVEPRPSLPVSCLVGSAIGVVGACAFELLTHGLTRAFVLLCCAAYVASALLAAWVHHRRSTRSPARAAPPPAGPLPDPWTADTEPALPGADSAPTLRR